MSDQIRFKDFDHFFYYSFNDVEDEVKIDVISNIVQPKRSLFYNRNLDSAGINDWENYPNSLTAKIQIPFDVVNSLAKRNQFVTNGQDGYIDRRVATSQAIIRVEGERDKTKITVLYIALANYKPAEVVVPTV